MTEITRRSCVFCLATDRKITHEHMLPTWYLQMAPEPPSGAHAITHTYHPPGATNPTREWTTDRLDLKVSGPCDDCNNGWLSDLENDAQPYLQSLIRGHHRTYYAEGQRLIALWAVKTSAISMLAAEHRDLRDFARSECRRLFLDRRPAPGTQIWTGVSNYISGGALHSFNVDASFPDETSVHYHATAIRIGHLVLQTVGPKVGNGKGPLHFMGVLGLAYTPFWPVEPPIVVVPKAALTDDDLQVMGDLFSACLIAPDYTS